MNHLSAFNDNYYNSSSYDQNITINSKEDWSKNQLKLRLLARKEKWEKYINESDIHIYTDDEVQQAFDNWQEATTDEDIHHFKCEYNKAYIENKRMNDAINALTMCVSHNTTFAESLLQLTPFQIWQTLETKYQDTSRSKLDSLVDELDSITMESNEDPDVFFDKIEDLNSQIKKLNPTFAKSNEEIVTLIGQKISKEKYGFPLEFIRNQQDDNNIYDNIDEVKRKIRNYYVRHYAVPENDNMKLISTNIAAFQISNENENNNKNNNQCGRELGPNDRCVMEAVLKCGYCGKNNHVEAECRKKKKDNGEYNYQHYSKGSENSKSFRRGKSDVHNSKNNYPQSNKRKHYQDQCRDNESEINNIFVGMVMGSSKVDEPTEVNNAATALLGIKISDEKDNEKKDNQAILPGDGSIYKSNQVSMNDCSFCVDSLEHAYRLNCYAEDYSDPKNVQVLPWHVVAEKEKYATVKERSMMPGDLQGKRDGAISPIHLSECVCDHCNGNKNDTDVAHVNDDGTIPKLSATIKYTPKVFKLRDTTNKKLKTNNFSSENNDDKNKDLKVTNVNLLTTSLGKTPQTIAQSFEDSDEDEIETHKEIANQVQVYHVGRTDCDNLQLSQEVQSTQSSSKQDDKFNRWILRDDSSGSSSTKNDLAKWSETEFGNLNDQKEDEIVKNCDSFENKIQDINSCSTYDDNSIYSDVDHKSSIDSTEPSQVGSNRDNFTHLQKYLMEEYSPYVENRKLDELPNAIQMSEREFDICNTYEINYWIALDMPTDYNIQALEESKQTFMRYKHNRLIEYWSDDGKILDGWFDTIWEAAQQRKLTWTNTKMKYLKFILDDLSNEEESEYKITSDVYTYPFNYNRRTLARAVYRKLISIFEYELNEYTREGAYMRAPMLGFKTAEDDMFSDQVLNCNFNYLKLNRITGNCDLSTGSSTKPYFDRIISNINDVVCHHKTNKNNTNQPSSVQSTLSNPSDNINHDLFSFDDAHHYLSPEEIHTNNANNSTSSPSYTTTYPSYTTTSPEEIHTNNANNSTSSPSYYTNTSSELSISRDNQTDNNTNVSAQEVDNIVHSYSSISERSTSSETSTDTNLYDSDLSSQTSYQYEPPEEYFNRPRLLPRCGPKVKKLSLMSTSGPAPTLTGRQKLPPKKRALMDMEDFLAKCDVTTKKEHGNFCLVISAGKNTVRDGKFSDDLERDEIELWVGDTGATGHCAKHNKRAKRYQAVTDSVTVADGSKSVVDGNMDLDLIVGPGAAIELLDVKCTKGITKNIISIRALLKDGAKLQGDRNNLIVKFERGKYEFNLNFKLSPYDGLYYLKAIRSENLPDNYVVLNPSTPQVNTIGVDSIATDINAWDTSSPAPLIDMDITMAHRQWGHCGEKLLHKIAKDNGYNLTGKLRECNGCGLVKAKAASVPRSTKRKATKVGERLFIDTAGPLPNTLGGNKFWTCAVDDYSNKTWVNFSKTKKNMLVFVEYIYEELKGKGHNIQYIRCDNAGEHLDELRFFCHKHGIHLEYTAPYTPQLNGRVEQRIHVIWQRALTMMTDAGLKKETQKLLWAEAVNMAVFLYDLTPNWRSNISAHELLTGEKASAWIPYLKEFGRIGLATKRTKEGGKIEHRAHSCIMVGYSHNHPKGCYRLYNPDTKKVIMSRDVKWNDFKPTSLRDQMGLFESDIGIEDSDITPDAIIAQDTRSESSPHRIVCDLTNEPTDTPISNTSHNARSPQLNPTYVSSPPRVQRHQAQHSPIVTKVKDMQFDPTTPNKIIVHEPGTPSTASSRSRSLTPGRRPNVRFNNNRYQILNQNDHDDLLATEIISNPPKSKRNSKSPLPLTTEKGMTMRSGRQLLRVTGDTKATKLQLNPQQNSNSVHLVQDEGEDIQELDLSEYNIKEALDNVGDHSITDPIISINLVQFDTKTEILYDDNDDTDFVFTFELSDQMLTPKTITEALGGPNKELWKLASIAEVNNFLKRGSWKIVKKKEVLQQNRKLIGTKWVFKIKNESDGSKRFKSRIVTLGYMQIPGIDYTERFSPVSTPSTIRIGLGLVLYYTGWDAELIDIEAAFLEGRLKNPVYIRLPKGMVELGFMTEEEYETHCAELTAGMYGCVDAALQYFLRFTEYVTKKNGMNYTQSEVDPCVFYRKDDNGKLKGIIIAYVDDCICCGEKDEIEYVKNSLKKEFGTVEDGRLRKLLGIKYTWNQDDNKERYITMSMEDKADEIIKAYEQYAKKTINTYDTPAVTGLTLESNEGKPIDEEEYRSIVGQIMFYATKISPEIANSIRNLSQHMINPGVQHWKALERLVGYIKGKEKHEIILRRPKELKNYSYVDASFADCKDTRRSTSGDIHTLGGCITSWSSKRMKSVTLSSAEAEYVSLTDACKEMKFQQMLIDELTGEYNYPGIIYEDNQAAIFLTKNKQVSARTKHIDTREHYVRELVNENRIDVEYVKSNENIADIMTKNTPLTIFKPFSTEILNGMQNTQNKGYKRSLNELRRENVEEPSKSASNNSSEHVFVLHSNGTPQYTDARDLQSKRVKGNSEGVDNSTPNMDYRNHYDEMNSNIDDDSEMLTPKNSNELHKDTFSSDYTYGDTVESYGTQVGNLSTREIDETKENLKETSS